MPKSSERKALLRSFMLHLMLRDAITPPFDQDAEDLVHQLQSDLDTFRLLCRTRYTVPRVPVEKCGNIKLAFEYAQDPNMHHRFVRMLRCSPRSFNILHEMIKDHEVFHNNSNNPQTPVEIQLAVTLFRLGRYGNGASVGDIACNTGISEGSVVNFTARCFTAIESFHDVFVRPLTPEEKEAEKRWIDKEVGFEGHCRDGWMQHDGTLANVYARPGFQGDAYFSRKGTYSLNVQVSIEVFTPKL